MMLRGVSWGGQSSHAPRFRFLLLSALVLGLVAVVGYAVQRELTRQQADAPAPAAASAQAQRALTGEEESYAAALWSNSQWNQARGRGNELRRYRL